jgi:hypothetical protein
MSLPLKAAKRFSELDWEEKLWALTHPLRAYKVWKISAQVREIANRKISDPDLDGDYAGGQVDAFRHILWMALLTQKFGANFARFIGEMHERSNKRDFKKGRLEEYQLPDATSMMMDLLNNEIGIELGNRMPGISLQSLIEEVKKLILEGRAWVIKKDEDENFLDLNGNKIPKKLWLGKWNTPKVLIKSDYRKGLPEYYQRRKNHKSSSQSR